MPTSPKQKAADGKISSVQRYKIKLLHLKHLCNQMYFNHFKERLAIFSGQQCKNI